MKTKNYTIIAFVFTLFLTSMSLFSQTFAPKPSGTSYILYDVTIPPAQNLIAYAAGSQYTTGNAGVIIKSTDAGETWQTIYPGTGTTTLGFKKIKFVSDTRGFAVGQGNTFLKTTDGGTTWTNITVQTDIYYYSCLEFYDANNGFLIAVTNSSQVIAYRTTDSGDTWTPITSTTNLQTQAVTYATANVMYSTGGDQKISKSTDAGNTWTTIKTGINTYYYFGINFKDANNGLVSGEDGEVLMTTNGGTTWTQILSTGYENLYSLIYRGSKIYAGGTDQNIYYSSNDGGSFTPVNTSSTSSSTLYGIAVFANGEALLCGSQGSIVKSTDFLSTSNVSVNENSINHFYNTETKTLSINSIQEININQVELYSIEGKVISTFKTIGNNIELDLNTIQNGVYFVKLNSVEGSNSSFKFIRN
ncbi:YCF48-related protein [uncultured Flavobacterium sp.]|uniref:YCF48-related protein n=1 Tax=uncultured Flavobacterium sp. TaxID=165435 RepID=UPI0030EF0DBD|tara:strand:+ start:1067 stop:2317 length:1251 start_codon:yes stop_codon:yes gene_type:complete